MCIVISEHPPVVRRANPRIHVRQTVPNHHIPFVPDLFLQQPSPPFSAEIAGLGDSLFRLAGTLSPPPLLAHLTPPPAPRMLEILAVKQIGCQGSTLFLGIARPFPPRTSGPLLFRGARNSCLSHTSVSQITYFPCPALVLFIMGRYARRATGAKAPVAQTFWPRSLTYETLGGPPKPVLLGWGSRNPDGTPHLPGGCPGLARVWLGRGF